MENPSNRNKLSQLTASRLGARLFRMSTGLFWAGKSRKFDKTETVTVYPGDVLIRQARPVKTGIEGMPDGGGFVSITITSDMVGQKFARSLWVEDKTGSGRATTEQKAFIKMARSMGALAGVARSDEDVARIIAGELLD